MVASIGFRVVLELRARSARLKFLTLFAKPLPIGIGMRENLQLDGERFARDAGPCRSVFEANSQENLERSVFREIRSHESKRISFCGFVGSDCHSL